MGGSQVLCRKIMSIILSLHNMDAIARDIFFYNGLMSLYYFDRWMVFFITLTNAGNRTEVWTFPLCDGTYEILCAQTCCLYGFSTAYHFCADCHNVNCLAKMCIQWTIDGLIIDLEIFYILSSKF